MLKQAGNSEPKKKLPTILGTLRYSGRGREGRQPEVKCSILGTN